MTEKPETDTSHDILKEMDKAHEEQPGEVLPEKQKDDAPVPSTAG